MADRNDERRREERASGLEPEERSAGSADPESQAEAILADSDERQEHSRDEGAPVERRTSDGRDLPS
ncbi:MAG: hypothetical protein M3Y91_14290 [Actinomycetota bacterium]|nr:hypothetical protein [Actinomycetota bacterium]